MQLRVMCLPVATNPFRMPSLVADTTTLLVSCVQRKGLRDTKSYVRDCILRMTKEAGMTPRLEANGLVGSNSNSRPADVLIEPPELDQRFRANGRQRHRVLDVVIT